MDQLIYFKCTGNPTNFADKLEISERSLYNYLMILEDLGAQIQFNRYINSYEYINEKRLFIKIEYK
jgi:hypothetical protein